MAWITVQEIELEYSNGWSETRTLKPGEEFEIPFDGVIVGSRSKQIWRNEES